MSPGECMKKQTSELLTSLMPPNVALKMSSEYKIFVSLNNDIINDIDPDTIWDPTSLLNSNENISSETLEIIEPHQATVACGIFNFVVEKFLQGNQLQSADSDLLCDKQVILFKYLLL